MKISTLPDWSISNGGSSMKARWNNQMMRLIICDDDPLFLAKIEVAVHQVISNMGLKTKVHTFSAMEQISDQLLSSCDIALLDIDFAHKEYCGLDIARKLRHFRSDSIVIFVTNYIEYAPEGYEVQAFRYVLKSEAEYKLEGYLRQAIQKLHESRESIKLQINGEMIDLQLQDILYIESQLHTVNLYVQKNGQWSSVKKYNFYASISNLEEQLATRGFLRIHKSYLVNMQHIRRYQCQEVELDNGTFLRASETRYSEQKQKYLLWKGKAING